jgi:acyl carrier protein
MTLQEAYQICPAIKVITLDDLTKAAQKVSGDKSFKLDFTKTFYDQGFDGLNCVEIIMELENKLNISIHDEVADFIVNEDSKPDFLLQEWRESQINKILND